MINQLLLETIFHKGVILEFLQVNKKRINFIDIIGTILSTKSTGILLSKDSM